MHPNPLIPTPQPVLHEHVPLFRDESLEAYRRQKNVLNGVIFGGIGFLAGQNFWQKFRGRTDPAALLGASIRHGAIMAIRWKVWVVTGVTWLLVMVGLLIGATTVFDHIFDEPAPLNWDPTGERPGYWTVPGTERDVEFTSKVFGSVGTVWLLIALHVIMGVFAIGATYVQHIDDSGFKRRSFYRWFASVGHGTLAVPWFVLNTLVLVCPIIVYLYTSTHVQL